MLWWKNRREESCAMVFHVVITFMVTFFPVGCQQGQGIRLSFILRALALFCQPSSSDFGAVATLLHVTITFLYILNVFL